MIPICAFPSLSLSFDFGVSCSLQRFLMFSLPPTDLCHLPSPPSEFQVDTRADTSGLPFFLPEPGPHVSFPPSPPPPSSGRSLSLDVNSLIYSFIYLFLFLPICLFTCLCVNLSFFRVIAHTGRRAGVRGRERHR